MMTYLSRWFVLPSALAMLVSVLVSGCATSQGYWSLKQTQDRIYWLMSHYRDQAAFGELTLGERERANTAYAAYESAFKQAFKDAGGNYSAPTPENVKELANELIRVVSSIPNIRT